MPIPIIPGLLLAVIPVSVSIPISVALMPAGGSVSALLLPSTALAICMIYISGGSAQAGQRAVSTRLRAEQGLIAYRHEVQMLATLCAISTAR